MEQNLDSPILSEDCTTVNNDPVVFSRECLLELMDKLTSRKERVVRMRFGLDDGSAHSREYVAAAFGITIERVRQIEAKRLRGVRLSRRSQKLKDYID